ncbi:hypothetical protein [Adhaeribacter rhizoryzae]|uniref:Uncharacterized protein n=1 Tax=Adhaeribacter rhizoryzae TaxID=2607907 RepID=A0A5M6DJZ2_9BACT|nr:hypothetical protein [Adhaeribacter rhizoryzae]KAA5547877.1 hypothetical protein F0145_08035 [Adhaeribacter rhizoryzae]
MKIKLLYVLAFIGMISMISKVIGFYQTEKLTRQYWDNCGKVKVGMTLKDARQIIGDLKYQYWSQDQESAEIIVKQGQNGVEYTLEYNMIFAGSDNMKLYFDPITLRVTKIFCGE